MPPIYDYKCKNELCGALFEVFYTSPSKVAEEETDEACPSCGSKEKERTPPKKTSFQLKGKWFKSGY